MMRSAKRTLLIVAGVAAWQAGCSGEARQFTPPAPLSEICDDCDGEPYGPTVDVPFPVCASVTGDRSSTPVDIVWTVDSSPSMTDEMGWIQQNINDFVAHLTEVTMDVRVTLLGGQQICVPEPLAGPDCQDGALLRHIREYVGSRDSLQKTISLYPQYRDFLRPGRKALVMTTDDNSDVSAGWFSAQLAALPAPGFGDDYVVHSIVAFGTHPRGCLTGAAAGTVYLDLTDATNGVKYPICETDWSRIFDELTAGIVGMVELPCAYAAPEVRESQVINPAQIHVALTEGGDQRALPRLQGADQCATQPGWFYEANSQTVRLCQETCRSPSASQVRVSFGCHDAIN